MSRVFASILLASVAAITGCTRAEQAPQVGSPTTLVEEARKQGLKNLFINPSLQIATGEPEAAAADLSEAATACRTPSEWRKLDRSRRFDGVVLAGSLTEFQPLLAHLAESPDFRVALVNHWGVLFTRQRPTPYAPPTPESVGIDAPETRPGILSQTAVFLDAVGLRRDASAYMDAAREAAPEDPTVCARAGALALARGRHREAIEQSDAALKIDPNHAAALEVKATALAAVGAANLAWQTAERLRSVASPDDMHVLYLHARLANAASAYTREQDSLERLVKLAESRGLPDGDYRVYLGQCYARQGLARPALEQLERAADSPGLSEDQRADIATAIETVRKHAGDLSR